MPSQLEKVKSDIDAAITKLVNLGTPLPVPVQEMIDSIKAAVATLDEPAPTIASVVKTGTATITEVRKVPPPAIKPID